jgi:hypothetical protein
MGIIPKPKVLLKIPFEFSSKSHTFVLQVLHILDS